MMSKPEPTTEQIQERHDGEQCDETNRLQKGRAYQLAHADRGLLLSRLKDTEQENDDE